MPILLMSSGFYLTSKAEKKLNKSFKGKKIAYIITASVVAEDKEYVKYRKEHMDKLGWDYEEIDITGMIEGKLRGVLKNKDIIYVEGGSTFYLLKAIRESGFERIVKEHLEKGKIYIGSSAGAYVACPNIMIAVWFNRRHSWDHCGLIEFSGMSLVPYLIKVHYTKEDDELLKQKRQESDYKIKALTDKEAILDEYKTYNL